MTIREFYALARPRVICLLLGHARDQSGVCVLCEESRLLADEPGRGYDVPRVADPR